jgi:hypothetical protein
MGLVTACCLGLTFNPCHVASFQVWLTTFPLKARVHLTARFGWLRILHQMVSNSISLYLQDASSAVTAPLALRAAKQAISRAQDLGLESGRSWH